MSTAPHRRAWIALYALIFQLLLPLAIPAQATTGQLGDHLVICTADGLKAVNADGSEPAKEDLKFSCPRCDGILHAPVIPAAPLAIPARLAAAQVVNISWAPDLPPSHAATTRHARGPPLHA